MKEFLFVAAIILLVLVLYFAYRKNFKILKVPSVCLITGGIKTGKSLLSVNLTTKAFKSAHRKWWFITYVMKKEIEEPLYYTNVEVTFGNRKRAKRLGAKYKPHKLDRCIVQLTLDQLLRLERFNYGSIIYIQEASLLADNMDFNNKIRNVDLSLFCKLIAHETMGGKMYVDTQSILDVHYAFKRVASTYLFIQKNINFFLFHILYVREMVNTENGVNNFTDDVDTTTRKVLIPFWYHNKYNRYEYSYLTDELDSSKKQFVKRNGVISFNPLYVERSHKHKEVKK